MREVSVAQAGGDVERADHLRHADARLAACTRVAVGHVGGGFLAVTMHTRDLGAPFHLGKGTPHHRGHHEDVSDAITGEHLGEHFGSDAFGVVSDGRHCCLPTCRGADYLIASGLTGEPTAPVIGIAGATNRNS